MLGVERGGIYFHSVIWLFVNNKVYIICIVVNVLFDLGVVHFMFLWLSS